MIGVWFGPRRADVAAVAFDKDGLLFDSQPFWVHLHAARQQALVALLGESPADPRTAAMLADWDALVGVRRDEGRVWVDRNGPLALTTLEQETVLQAGLVYRHRGIHWDTALELARAAMADGDGALSLAEAMRPLPGMPGTLQALRRAGLKVGVLTQDARPRTLASLELFGLGAGELDFVITPEAVAHAKPAPDMVLAACRLLGVSPGEIAHVGDSQSDVRMARAAGCLAVAIPAPDLDPAPFAAEADVVLGSLLEIHPADGPEFQRKGGK